MLAGFVALIAIFLLMPISLPARVSAVIVFYLFGAVNFLAGAPLQSRIVDQARDAPNLASILNQGAFNLGNAIGASVGGAALTAGLAYSQLPLLSAAVTVLTGALVVIASRIADQPDRESTA